MEKKQKFAIGTMVLLASMSTASYVMDSGLSSEFTESKIDKVILFFLVGSIFTFFIAIPLALKEGWVKKLAFKIFISSISVFIAGTCYHFVFGSPW